MFDRNRITKWGNLLRKYRFDNYLTLEQMAEKVGMTKANYYLIETCQRKTPKIETFTVLATILNKDITELREIYYESNYTFNKRTANK